jgi:hypothetical protein
VINIEEKNTGPQCVNISVSLLVYDLSEGLLSNVCVICIESLKQNFVGLF